VCVCVCVCARACVRARMRVWAHISAGVDKPVARVDTLYNSRVVRPSLINPLSKVLIDVHSLHALSWSVDFMEVKCWPSDIHQLGTGMECVNAFTEDVDNWYGNILNKCKGLLGRVGTCSRSIFERTHEEFSASK